MWIWRFIKHGLVLFLRKVGTIPGNDHEIKRQKYVAVYQRSDGWPREVLHVAKTKTIRNWELNTSITL